MQHFDRRRLLGAFLFSGVAVAAAVLPLEPAEAQVVVVAPRRRRRRWVCWWSRGRRVCGWRWF